MKNILIFLAILVIGLFQTTIWGFNFLLLIVLVLSLILPAGASLFWAFLAGLILNLLGGEPLGYSSLGFLLPNFLLLAYRQRFSFQNPLFVFVFSFISYLLFTFVSQKPINLFEGVILAISIVIFRFLAPFLFEVQNPKQLKLEV